MPKRILLDRLLPRFVALCKAYMENEGINQGKLAVRVGIQRSHLNAILNGGRSLSAYYLHLFVRQGIIGVKQIYDEKPESERESEFWETAEESENFKLLGKLARLRKIGIDIEDILNKLYPEV